MSGDQRHNNFPETEDYPLLYNPTIADNGQRLESAAYDQAPTFDNLHEPFQHFGSITAPHENPEFAGTPVDYQHTYLPADFDPHNNVQIFPNANLSTMHAPTGFYNPPFPENAWVDEIHPSYTPAGGEMLEWAQSDFTTYNWLTGAVTSPGQQQIYQTSSNVFPASQYTPEDSLNFEGLAAQHFGPETITQMPLQAVASTGPASVALRVKNKKDVTTAQQEKPSASGFRPLRVTKTKKGQKGNNNNNVINTSKHEACWRCKRYRKACIGHEVCKECATAGFRVWPSAIGCRRGAMEGFVEKLMPSHSVGVLRNLRLGVLRTSNWRKALYQPDEIRLSPGGTNLDDRWDMLRFKVQSTMVFGADFSALVDILAEYENSRKTEIPIWTQAIILLSSTCDFYHFFVASSNIEIQLPNLINATIKLRKALLRSWDLFLKFSLSGRRENWFPAFLTVVLGICSVVILMDAVPSVPNLTRKAIWGDIEAVITDLRVRQHMMSLELLRIGAKGINPLKLDYWVLEEELDSEGRKVRHRNPKGMALLGQDSAAFDGFIALRQWHAKYKGVMREGNGMWDSVPYTLTHVQAIAALSRVFEF